MAVNVFEGGRRISRALMVLWAIFVGLVYLVEGDSAVDVRFEIVSPGAPPRRIDSDCQPSDAMEWVYGRKTNRGTRYHATLCFRPMEFPSGKLIPYKAENGVLYGDARYSLEVGQYTDRVAEELTLSALDEQWIDNRRWVARWENARFYAALMSGGLLVIWLVSAGIGWIVRGFVDRNFSS